MYSPKQTYKRAYSYEHASNFRFFKFEKTTLDEPECWQRQKCSPAKIWISLLVNGNGPLSWSTHYIPPVLRCLLLNYPWDGQNPLAYYIQRTGYLTISQAGALTDELFTKLQSETYDFTFLHLSTTDEVLSKSFLDVLNQQRRLIITSPFPRQLYQSYGLNPIVFLTEPYTYDRFVKCVELLV